MIGILLWLVVLCLVWYLVKFVIGQVGGPPWAMTVLNVVMAIVVLVWLLGVLGVGPRLVVLP